MHHCKTVNQFVRYFQTDSSIIVDVLKRYARLWPSALKGMRERPYEMLGRQANKTLDAFCQSVVGNQNHEKTLYFLQILRTLGSLNFQSSLNPGETFQVDLISDSLEITGTATTAYMDVDVWLNAFFSAIILRDGPIIRSLCKVPEETHKTANLRPNDFDLAFVQATKGLFNSEVNIGQLLVDAMIAAKAEDKMEPARFEYIDHILVPQIPLYRCILSSDETEFNEKLQEAILEHKEFWGQEDKQYKKRGWISLPLMGIAAIALDNKSFNITFETDYIPNWLVKREF